MTELLAVLTSIFVVYALYEVFATVSQSGDGLERTAADSRPAPRPAPVKQAEAAPAAVAAIPPKQAKPVAEPDKHLNLRDPKTGDLSPAPSNYRFAKKWIKEALVTEGLLPKVYKNSELTETLNLKAKEAIEQFKHLEKFQA
ncbi:MAG: hypothetical protein ACOYMG_19165 [Candidatus Methylumidiphilus sp.]